MLRRRDRASTPSAWGSNEGWSSVIAIIVGTITVQSTPNSSICRQHSSGLEQRHERRDSARRWDAERAAHRGCVEHRCLVQVHTVLPEADREPDVVQVQDLGALLEDRSFGESRRPAGVHEHRGVVLLRLSRDGRRSVLDQILVTEVTRSIAVADEHDVAEGQVGAHLGDVARRSGPRTPRRRRRPRCRSRRG